MVNALNGAGGQGLNSLQHITLLGMNLCRFKNFARSLQHFGACFVQVIILQELERILFRSEQVLSRPNEISENLSVGELDFDTHLTSKRWVKEDQRYSKTRQPSGYTLK